MSRIRSRDTVPELQVRSALHRAGYRFRLHRKDLPGRPDIVLPKHSTVVFVHGCFWHRHPGCRFAYLPKSRVAFWRKKFNDNVERDRRNRRDLRRRGWRVITIWECQAGSSGRWLPSLKNSH
jgi:DNA mismatch endonuclease (patch repair protein)